MITVRLADWRARRFIASLNILASMEAAHHRADFDSFSLNDGAEPC
jgi:hypothetical protein